MFFVLFTCFILNSLSCLKRQFSVDEQSTVERYTFRRCASIADLSPMMTHHSTWNEHTNVHVITRRRSGKKTTGNNWVR